MFKKSIVFLGLIFAFSFAGVQQADAATWYAESGASGPGSSIFYPIDLETLFTSGSLSSGDRVVLTPGTHSIANTLEINESVRLYPFRSATIDCSLISYRSDGCIQIGGTKSGLNVEMHSIEIGGNPYINGIDLKNSSALTLNDIVLSELNTGLKVHSSNGTALVNVKNTSFLTLQSDGIEVAHGASLEAVTESTFDDLGGGVLLYDTGGSTKIENNTFGDLMSAVIALNFNGSMQVTVKDNVISEMDSIGIFGWNFSSSELNMKIHNNEIYGPNGSNGITLSGNNTLGDIRYNKVRDFLGTAIEVNDGEFTIANNLVTDSLIGIYSTANSALINHNTIDSITSNPYYIQSGDGINVHGNGSHTIVNNIITNTYYDSIDVNHASNTNIGSNIMHWSHSVTTGTIRNLGYTDLGGNLFVDPQLDSNYAPLSGSPAIGAEDTGFHAFLDLYKTIRGTIADIGAIEVSGLSLSLTP